MAETKNFAESPNPGVRYEDLKKGSQMFINVGSGLSSNPIDDIKQEIFGS